MKPAKFDYYDPRSLEEALTLLDTHQGDGKVLAGGQSLMPLLNMRLARPNIVVDINRIKSSTTFGQRWRCRRRRACAPARFAN
jgi:CO/xanthine dehydrogenase FAD-binding subunit